MALQARYPQWLMGRVSDGQGTWVWEASSKIHVILMTFNSTGCCSPGPCPPEQGSTPQYSVWMGQERGDPLWQCPTQLGKPDTHLHFAQEKSPPEKVSLDTQLHSSGGWAVQIKWNCSSYHLQCIQFLTPSFFLQWCADISLLDSWTSKYILLPVGGSKNLEKID